MIWAGHLGNHASILGYFWNPQVRGPLPAPRRRSARVCSRPRQFLDIRVGQPIDQH